jgi:hypothetical protein
MKSFLLIMAIGDYDSDSDTESGSSYFTQESEYDEYEDSDAEPQEPKHTNDQENNEWSTIASDYVVQNDGGIMYPAFEFTGPARGPVGTPLTRYVSFSTFFSDEMLDYIVIESKKKQDQRERETAIWHFLMN